jgi:AraC-like DNA-binding protein
LFPYLEFLRDIGAPVERGLRHAKLPTMLTDDADTYLPQLPTITFLTEMSRTEGIDDLSLRVLRRLQFTDLGAPLAAAVHWSPTLEAALETFRELAPIEDSNLEFWITYQETTANLCILNRFPLEPQGLRFEDWNEIMVIVAIVRALAGATWKPKEIALRSNAAPSAFASEQFPNTRFLVGQDAAWITVPRDLLRLPRLSQSTAADTWGVPGAEGTNRAITPVDFTTSLRQMLAPYLRDGYPAIDLAAEIANTSVRTLQRRLRKFGISYSDLVQQVRFEVATKLLRNTDMKTLNIAYELGYEDPSHFARAFRRTAGMSPREYRRQYLN